MLKDILKDSLPGLAVAGVGLLLAILLDSPSEKKEASCDDSFHQGIQDAILDVGRRSGDSSYTIGYNIWSKK